MENDIVFYQGIFKSSIILDSVVFFSALCIVTSLEVMDFRQNAGFLFKAVMLRDTCSDVIKQIDKVNLICRSKSLVNFAEIATVDEEADGVYYCTCHSYVAN